MSRAYGLEPVVEGIKTTESQHPRLARGRPNWWVILAVSLGLMALLVATAGNPRRPVHGSPALATAPTKDAHDPRRAAGTTTTTTASPVAPSKDAPTSSATSLLSSSSHAGTTAPPSGPTTTTSVATTTTTTAPQPVVAQPADRTESQGVIEPPQQRSSSFGFTGTGAMQVSVVWSGDTYLTMQVSCPSGSQSVGGSSAMAASLPDASGSCLATVSEPTTESTALTYTITIGPAGG